MIERRKSRIQGWGVFATQAINKNKRIVTYDGEKIPNKESLKREAGYLKKGHISRKEYDGVLASSGPMQEVAGHLGEDFDL